MFTRADRDTLRAELAVSIAKSRYEAWDPAGQDGTPWEVFRGQHPDTAEGIYLADGYRDADAALPLVIEVLEHYGIAVEPTAAEAAAAEDLDDSDDEPTDEELAAIEAEALT